MTGASFWRSATSVLLTSFGIVGPCHFDEHAAALYPGPDKWPYDAEDMRDAFDAGARAAALGYVPRKPAAAQNPNRTERQAS